MANPKLKVCIIDDDMQVSNSISALLQAADFHATSFQSAEIFLEHCTADAPSEFRCLILDIRLPGMSGLELQEELDRRGIDIPTILISGHACDEIKEFGLANGANILLEKPFDGHQLVQEVKRLVAMVNPNQQ